jgi:hypothetical protein
VKIDPQRLATCNVSFTDRLLGKEIALCVQDAKLKKLLN